MLTTPPAPDDRHRANGHRTPAAAAGYAGSDPAGSRRARLASFWVVALQRFRDYAHKTSDPADRPQRQHEEDR
jgi:hypothetical protein